MEGFLPKWQRTGACMTSALAGTAPDGWRSGQPRQRDWRPETKAYLRYFFGHYHAERMIATVSDENVPSWKLAERAGFTLTDKRMYKNLNDDIEELYRFYVMEKGNCRPA